MIIYTHNRSKKKKPTKAQVQQHEDFMISVNKIKLPSGSTYLPKKPIKKSLAPTPIRREVVRHPSLPDTHLGALPPTGMMRNLHKLSIEDRAIVQEMSECIAPIHKSNLIYITPGMNPASLGRKNEVL
jgi:hypothetical protein